MSRKRTMPAAIVIITVGLLVPTGALPCAAADQWKPSTSATFARVNGKAISTDVLMEAIEQLYPTASVHARSGGSPELRQRAMDEVILGELIWQQAVKVGKIVPLAEAQQEMLRTRRRYGAKAFDADLRAGGMSRQQYVEKLQRAMTIQRARKEHVELQARVGPKVVRAYYEINKSRFRRPERARFRLILVAVEPHASKEVEQQARKKANDLYAQLKAGKDFADLAYQFSDDLYRVKGGDVGWMHKGSMDPEFEPIALSLPIGQFTAPFRTPLGYSILKVEAREPAKDMSFVEMRDKLKAQLTALKSRQLQQDWEADLKKNARIEILDKNAGVQGVNAQHKGLKPAH